jgi:hypothetical protein
MRRFVAHQMLYLTDVTLCGEARNLPIRWALFVFFCQVGWFGWFVVVASAVPSDGCKDEPCRL